MHNEDTMVYVSPILAEIRDWQNELGDDLEDTIKSETLATVVDIIMENLDV